MRVAARVHEKLFRFLSDDKQRTYIVSFHAVYSLAPVLFNSEEQTSISGQPRVAVRHDLCSRLNGRTRVLDTPKKLDAMLKPLIAIFSQKPRFGAELPTWLRPEFEVLVCESVAEVEELLAAHRPSAFVADFERVISSGHLEDQLLQELMQAYPDMSVFMITGSSCPEPLVHQADHERVLHLTAPLELEKLVETIRDRLGVTAETSADASDAETGVAQDASEPARPAPQPEAVRTVPAASAPEPRKSDSSLEGSTRRFDTNSPELRQMLQDLQVAALHDVTILLIGETGCGKTFLSKLIHEVSPRRDEPFLHVACGALPAELIESELFGHVKGAFTSAHADKEGKFLAAGRGTVLLDEIDVLGPEQQVKLLKVIETGEFEPVGSNKTYTSQARLVVASNLNLQPLVEAGRFRPDLYYRLNMLKFELLPLRRRKEDIVPMARKFVEMQTAKHGIQIRRIDQGMLDALIRYPWPGNVRELENVIQRAVIYCRDGELKAEHLPAHIVSNTAGPTNDPTVSLNGSSGVAPASSSPEPAAQDLSQQIASTEREIIEQTLYNNNFSRTNTAKELGISRVTLYNKMKKYGLTQ